MCDCIHSDVCRYSAPIVDAFREILLVEAGGSPEPMAELRALIVRSCCWRRASEIEQGREAG
jgi:hypothetical protein